MLIAANLIQIPSDYALPFSLKIAYCGLERCNTHFVKISMLVLFSNRFRTQHKDRRLAINHQFIPLTQQPGHSKTHSRGILITRATVNMLCGVCSKRWPHGNLRTGILVDNRWRKSINELSCQRNNADRAELMLHKSLCYKECNDINIEQCVPDEQT